MVEVGEEQEEEIWEEEGEFETMWISPIHLFQVDFLSAPLNSSGVSSGHPFRQIRHRGVESS